MKQFKDYLITPQQITVIFTEGPPACLQKDDPKFEELRQLIAERRHQEIVHLLDKSAAIKDYTKGKFLVQNGVVVIEDETLPTALSDKLLQLMDAGEETRPLERFWYNLKQNPSEDSKRDLFDFLRANKIPITPTGCFIAYRRVRDDYKDFYTGKMDNTPGNILKMPRKEVDSNRNATCSKGLHVAAYAYASNSYHAGSGLLLEVEVNPRDVVAVPPDYQQKKMRVCRFRVLRRSIDGELTDLVYRKDTEERYKAKIYDK